jgi:nitrogen-specific signal transduction histidine kinase
MNAANPDFPDDFLNSFSANIAIFDSEFNLIWHNHAFAHFVSQFNPGKQAGTGLAAVWPDAQYLLAPYLQRLQTGDPMYMETVNIRRGETETYWDLVVRPYPILSDPPQFVLMMHDVTNHILTYQGLERQMADRMRKLKALYDVMQVAGESLDLTTMVMRALRRVLTAVQAAVGIVHLLDEAGQQLQLVGHFGLTEAMQEESG